MKGVTLINGVFRTTRNSAAQKIYILRSSYNTTSSPLLSTVTPSWLH